MDFSVVIPARNESENIEPLAGEIRAALDGRYDYELIYVDDGSDDDTLARLQAIKRGGFERLRVLHYAPSCGQSTAIRTGVEAARAQWIVTLDADGQNDPADIPRLFETARAAGGDAPPPLVAGYRRRRRDSWLKRVSSRIANTVRGRLLGDQTPDTGCGLKCFSRAGFLALPYFDHMHRFLPALFRRAGAAVAIVEVNHRPRQAGKSNYGLHNRLWVGIVDLCGVLWLQRRNRLPKAVTEV